MKILTLLACGLTLASCLPVADNGYEATVKNVLDLSYPDVNSKRKLAYYKANPDEYEKMIIEKSSAYIDSELEQLLKKYVEERRLLRAQEYRRHWNGYSSPEMSINFDENWIFGWKRRPDDLKLLNIEKEGKFVRATYSIKFHQGKNITRGEGIMNVSFVGDSSAPVLSDISYDMEYSALGTKKKSDIRDVFEAETKKLRLLRIKNRVF